MTVNLEKLRSELDTVILVNRNFIQIYYSYKLLLAPQMQSSFILLFFVVNCGIILHTSNRMQAELQYSLFEELTKDQSGLSSLSEYQILFSNTSSYSEQNYDQATDYSLEYWNQNESLDDSFFQENTFDLLPLPKYPQQDDSQDDDQIYGIIIDHENFREVFKEVQIKVEKNKNIPKHLLKQMMDNYHANKEIFDVYPQIKNEVKRFIANERKIYRQNKNWNNGLAGMNKFFRLDKESSKNPKLRSFLTRNYPPYPDHEVDPSLTTKQFPDLQIVEILQVHLQDPSFEVHQQLINDQNLSQLKNQWRIDYISEIIYFQDEQVRGILLFYEQKRVFAYARCKDHFGIRVLYILEIHNNQANYFIMQFDYFFAIFQKVFALAFFFEIFCLIYVLLSMLAMIINNNIHMNFSNTEPIELSPRSSDHEDQVDVDIIIRQSKLSSTDPQGSNILPLQSSITTQPNASQLELQNQQLDQIELQMLVEECEDLISKISPNIHNFYLQEQTTVMSDVDESFTMKREKNRLEKEYIELCLEIERQQKELQNFRFKVQVAQKQAQYYSRQIKQKSAILQNLQQHSKKGRLSFRKG